MRGGSRRCCIRNPGRRAWLFALDSPRQRFECPDARPDQDLPRGRKAAGPSLRRSRDRLPARRLRARLPGGRSIRSCRRDEEEPAQAAAARCLPLLRPRRRPVDPARLRGAVDHRRPQPPPADAGPAARVRGRAVRSLPAPMKVLLVTMYFPPAGGGGVQRPLKFATHLPSFGIETHVLAPDDPKWVHRDDEATPPTQAWVHRVRYHGPRGRIPSEELYALEGVDRLRYQAGALFRRALVPDISVTWAPNAITAAIRIVRSENIDVVLTTSPPNSINLIGAAVKKATGVKWIADLRDPLVADADNPVERLPARAKENVQRVVARLVASQADAIVTAWDGIADEIRTYEPKAPITVIPNGADYDDFDGLDYTPGDRFRITHAGSFFGKRNPRPFLIALQESGLENVVARFVGELTTRDREWAQTLGLGDPLELLPFGSRRRSLAYQRDSEALLLLLPQAGERGTPVLPGKIFEYLAAERPILAAVPPAGAAANLIREADAGVVVPPDDTDAIREALLGLEARWRAGQLNGTALRPELRDRISRRRRVEEL